MKYYVVILDNSTDDDSESNNSDISDSISLDKNYKRLKKRKIVRFKDFKIEDDSNEYYRSQILLYLPWRSEKEEIENVDLKQKYLLNEKEITDVRISFISIDLTSHKVTEIISELENEEIEYNYKPRKLIDNDFNNDVLFDKTENTAQGEVGSFFKIKKIDETEYFKIMRELNYKQRQYCNHVRHSFKYNRSPVYEYVS